MRTQNINIIIDPRCRINYASYYIKGMYDIYGSKNIKFKNIDAQEENLFENIQDYNKCLIFIAESESFIKKIVIDFDDSASISMKHYEWCDVYSKINTSKTDSVKYKKLLSIGPGFGIDFTNFQLFLLLFKIPFFKNKPVSTKIYIKNFLYSKIRRRKYDEYLKSQSQKDYIFAISTLWYDPLTYDTTNKYRIKFFEICKRIYDKVEGGFFYITDDVVLKQFPKYIDYKTNYSSILYSKRVSPSEYIKKTKKSAVVFNTPSVSGCHGWKLGEFLAMGKAIISTPLNNVMPEGLINNKNIVYVETEKELEPILKNLASNNLLRNNLENDSFIYFETNLSPSAVISKIINTAFKTKNNNNQTLQ